EHRAHHGVLDCPIDQLLRSFRTRRFRRLRTRPGALGRHGFRVVRHRPHIQPHPPCPPRILPFSSPFHSPLHPSSPSSSCARSPHARGIPRARHPTRAASHARGIPRARSHVSVTPCERCPARVSS